MGNQRIPNITELGMLEPGEGSGQAPGRRTRGCDEMKPTHPQAVGSGELEDG